LPWWEVLIGQRMGCWGGGGIRVRLDDRLLVDDVRNATIMVGSGLWLGMIIASCNRERGVRGRGRFDASLPKYSAENEKRSAYTRSYFCRGR